MNKQEQKNKLWALKWIDKEIEENERHAHQKTGTEANTDYWKGYIASCKNIRYIVKELDEHPKHVMPKFFDDWAKRVIAKHDEFYAISLVARAGWGYGVDFELSENGSSSESNRSFVIRLRGRERTVVSREAKNTRRNILPYPNFFNARRYSYVFLSGYRTLWG